MNCKNCKSKRLKKIIFLNKQPISSVYLKKPNYKLKIPKQEMGSCSSDKRVQ